MSSHSYDTQCWKCGGSNMMMSQDNKPPSVSGECLDCGYVIYTDDRQMDLKEVNSLRKDYDMEEIKILKKQIN